MSVDRTELDQQIIHALIAGRAQELAHRHREQYGEGLTREMLLEAIGVGARVCADYIHEAPRDLPKPHAPKLNSPWLAND